MKISFWNTNRNVEINPYVQDIIIENGIDIMVLAEYEDNINNLRSRLWSHNIHMEKYISVGCDRITLLGKCKNVEPCYQNTYCSLQDIQGEYILGCVHFPSKTHCDRKKKDIAIRRVIQEIQRLEEESACQNTIVVGDFNENPYEGGCLAADGFHGLPDYFVAQKECRKILGEEFKMFYNPMWNLFGDFSVPSGTFFYPGNEVENPFWNMYDQVMIRPCLRNRFVDNKLKIICQAGTRMLVTEEGGKPDIKISDHLPIVFELKEG